jgi:hypothetical protein
VNLTKRSLDLPEGGRLELDGASDEPPIIVEAWAHIGRAKSAQKHKLMTDAFKLIFAAQFVSPNTRKILLLADPQAGNHLRGSSWMAQALKASRVEIRTVELAPEVVATLHEAQRRQFR